ncbi:hypothetical protein V8E53_014812 [Lactarius tabidus]
MSLRQLRSVIRSVCLLAVRSTLALSQLVLTSTVQTDEVPVPQLMARDHPSPPPHRGKASTNHATTLVPRRQSGRISTQALAAIVLCSTVVFCAFIGCLLQLPAAFYSWRRRARLGTPTGTQQSSTNSNTAEFPDAEVGDQPIPMGRYLSPPPPYTRAPSYESENTEGSSARRSTCAP